MPTDIWTQLAPAAPAPPALPGSRASASPQPAHSKAAQTSRQSRAGSSKIKKKRFRDKPPLEPHLTALCHPSDPEPAALHIPKKQILTLHQKTPNPPLKATQGVFPETARLWRLHGQSLPGEYSLKQSGYGDSMDSHLLAILQNDCRISLTDKQSWAKPWAGGLSKPELLQSNTGLILGCLMGIESQIYPLSALVPPMRQSNPAKQFS